MNTSNLIAAISKHITLDEEEVSFFISVLLPVKIRQGEMVEKPGDTSKYFVHVVSGCLMSYYTDKTGIDHVIQFAQAGWWTGDLPSFTKQIPAIYSTRALTDSEVLLLPKTGMDDVLGKYLKFERYFRILFQNSLETHQNRLIQNLSSTAEERYLAFGKKYPSLEQFVPQKYIASYLGITPEFLSKIRRKLMEK
ncbi:MAG: Crp/Fnr family transcriptional regulator [Cyclobacteriaceae bacterium]|nr:Crp/Fnr family transcriptional regulator [Cyclobacteriaceae bacterium]